MKSHVRKSQEPTKGGRLAYGVTEYAESIGTSANFIRLEIERGKIRAIRRGRRILIPIKEAQAYAGLGPDDE